MKEKYRDHRFNKSTRAMIVVLNGIAEEYQKMGYVLTVRQMYYQLVARDVVPNTMKSYKRVASIINDARLAGLIDWDVIEDRTRAFVRRSHWTKPSDILRSAARSYHVDMWATQDARPFVIIEKEALVGILEATCSTYDTPILAARGYPSSSVLREFAKRDLLCDLSAGQRLFVIHCGDHDPSGIDMTRDLEDRLRMLTRCDDVEVKRVALNMDQVEEQKPPPNPAKVTDARFAEYERRFGQSSWELDALSPEYLNNVVRREFDAIIDADAWAEREAHIKESRAKIEKIADKFDGKRSKK